MRPIFGANRQTSQYQMFNHYELFSDTASANGPVGNGLLMPAQRLFKSNTFAF